MMSPPLPVPVVSAVIKPWPEMERVLFNVPRVIVPPVPPLGPVSSVEALMRESPEKVIARSRGVLVLRLMEPALPELAAFVVSWDPPEMASL